MWELREGLRERGESWHKWPDEDSTTWQAYSNPHTATESMDGTLIVTGLTPEQAIEATLGRGTCTLEKVCDGYLYFRVHECNECGTRFAYRAIRSDKNARPKFCPNCGARIVEVDE